MMICKHFLMKQLGARGALADGLQLERCGLLMSLEDAHQSAAREMMALAAAGGSSPRGCDFHGSPPCPYYEP